MKKYFKISLITGIFSLLFLASCVFPGTGTINIYNKLTGSRNITALYLYLQSANDKGSSLISSPLAPDDNIAEYFVKPGNYTIEAEIDNGVDTASESITVEEGVFYYRAITDNDII